MKIRRIRRAVPTIALVLSTLATLATLAILAPRATASGPAPDPWTGKSRSDLVTLLGEPTKDKADGNGSLLVYKLLRLNRGVALPPSIVPLDVPGVGLAGRPVDRTPPRDSGMGIEPTRLDSQGRPVEDGMTGQQSTSVEWDEDSKKVTRSWEDRSAVAGKLTLKFRLDADGTIESWSVSPKQAAAAP